MMPEGDPSTNASPDGSLAARLRAHFGRDVDPKVSLVGDEPETVATFSSALVARLSGRSASFGRYELKDEIARGGMGAIFKVWDEDLHRHLAMKVILGQVEAQPSDPESALSQSRKLARFLEEAQVTGQLDHPGVVPVHELGLDPEGRVYFTMKFLKGRSLKDVFDLVAVGRDGWTTTRALGVLLKVCEAMAYAHHKGVIHRDLKPANVMVGKFGEVCVMDWGLARILGRKDDKDIRVRDDQSTLSTFVRSDRDEHRSQTPDSPLHTMAGDVVGTPAYMPFEQAAGRVEEVGPTADVYALGAMLYHLFAGHMPYVPTGARLTNYAVWGLVQQGPPTPIAKLAPGMPAELVAICEKAMARDWNDRYRDMSELAADLSAFLEHRVVAAYQTGAWAETKKWIERNKPLAASLGAGVLALIVGMFVLFALKERADRNAEVARESQREVLRLGSLSVIEELTQLENEANRLWPAEPSMIGKYEAWLERAKHLVDGRAADPAKGIELTLSLEDYKTELADLRGRALPLTDAEKEADRKLSLSYTDWQRAKAESLWIARMMGEEDWPRSETVPPSSQSPDELNTSAWHKVNPTSPGHGEELQALNEALQAVTAAREEDRPQFRDTLAWAYYRNQRFDDALAEERRALNEVGAEFRDQVIASSKQLADEIESWRTEVGKQKHVERKSELDATIAQLAEDVELKRTFRFESGRDRWRHGQLSTLVAGIEALRDPSTGLFSAGMSPDRSWGIVRRREFANEIETKSLASSDLRARWSHAIAAIEASPKYQGMQLEPVIGLVPLGADPESGLWEFSHVGSAEHFEVAARGTDGKLTLTKDSGVVLVLIPGGTFRMGAQQIDPKSANYDPEAQADELRLHEVTLAPFFISKFELTQAQWLRFAGKNPSFYEPSNYDHNWDANGPSEVLLHPAERVSWDECMQMLPRFGLTLPTEAQWEFTCRAETTTVYWSGEDPESLQGVANVSDFYGKTHGNEEWQWWEQALNDGQTVHAQVGRFRANPFGLHDTHGNVWEWCRDGYGDYILPLRERDGERQIAEPKERVFRGGSFAGMAKLARSAERSKGSPDSRKNAIGLRPAAVVRLL